VLFLSTIPSTSICFIVHPELLLPHIAQ